MNKKITDQTKIHTSFIGNTPFSASMRTSASLIAMIAAGAFQPALAQDDEEGVFEEQVVIVGQRASIQSSQAIKQNAEEVMDAITATDIGSLPDRSIADTLQRVPGITVERASAARDPVRMSAEPSGVFIRGLRWVKTELNGRDIYSADSGQALSFSDVSADLMAGVDVYKNPSAEHIEGGIGGIVNLRTRMPFDQEEMVASASAEYSQGDMIDDGVASFSGLFSNQWGYGNGGEIGVLFAASLQDLSNRTDSLSGGRYEPYDVSANTAIPFDTVYVPTGVGFRRVDWEQERNSFNTAIQISPNEDLTFTITAFYAESETMDFENAVGSYGGWGGNYSPDNGTYTYDERGWAIGGTVPNAAIDFNTRHGDIETTTADYSAGFKYFVNENWSISGDLQHVESDAGVMSMTVFTQAGAYGGGGTGGTAEWDFSNTSNPSMSFVHPTEGFYSDPANYWWAAAMDHLEDNTADSDAARVDLEYLFSDSTILKSFRFGVRATDKTSVHRETGYNWGFLSNQYWGGAGSADQVAWLDEYVTDEIEFIEFDDFQRGDTAIPIQGWFGTRDLVADNVTAYDDLQSTLLSGWGWAPLSKDPEDWRQINAAPDNENGGWNTQDEKTQAAYAVLRFEFDTSMPIDGNIGVRYVKTDLTATSKAGSAGGIPDACTGGTASADCADAVAFVNGYNAGYGAGEVTQDHSYNNVLPSANIRFELQDDLTLRFGASRGMVRPEFTQTRPFYAVNFAFQGTVFDPNLVGYQGTGSRGNIELEPTTADQLDASLEWYFAEAGSLTFAAFQKDLKDYVTSTTTIEEITAGGETYNFEVNQYVNAADGKLKGFELAYQQFFDTLPGFWSGFGVMANYTYIDNQGGVNTAVNRLDPNQVDGASDDILPIEGMSDTAYNFALMYEQYDVSARLAYNWREGYLMTSSAANLNVPVWADDRGQWDAQISYSFNENFKAGFQISNLTKEGFTQYVASSDRGLDNGIYNFVETDQRMAIYIRARY